MSSVIRGFDDENVSLLNSIFSNMPQGTRNCRSKYHRHNPIIIKSTPRRPEICTLKKTVLKVIAENVIF
jgi:hypothetical protein